MPTIQRSRSEEFKEVYSNNARMATSPFDFTMMFGRMIEVGPTTGLEELVNVRVSPYMFKVFVQNMTVTLEAWQEVFGDIATTSAVSNKDTILDALKKMKEASKEL